MAAMTASSSNLHSLENVSQPNSKSSSPTSPSSFQNQQATPPRSFISLSTNVRVQATSLSNTSINGFQLEPPTGMAYNDFIRTWTDDHVVRWLTNIKCGSHAELFKANDIRGDVLLELDQDTLKEMGVASIGDRLRMLNAVKLLRQKSSARAPVYNATPPRLLVNGDFSSPGTDSMHTTRTTPESSPTTRLPPRGRPAPLQLDQNSRENLPRIVHDSLSAPDSARIHHIIRPLPQPVHANTATPPVPATPNPGFSSSSSTRSHLPPLPPAPRVQPPLPPPTRPTARTLASQFSGRRTPTQADVPSYVTSPLPPAPNSLLTPNTGTGNWTGYGSPANPRAGQTGIDFATSPHGSRVRLNLAVHGRNVSLSGIESPVSTSPVTKLPPRPMTSNNSSHPYAHSSTLQPPAAPQQGALSPISESFNSQNGSTSSPMTAYSVGRGPFNRPNTPSHGPTPSLDDLRRRLVKFQLSDEGHSYTINVADCKGGIEVLEKVLKKFGKAGGRNMEAGSVMEHAQTEEGGLSVDGWGVYIDWHHSDGPGEPLTEAELMAICHAPDNPVRESGLTLRRTGKTKRPKQIFGPMSGQFNSPTTPQIVGPKFSAGGGDGDGGGDGKLLPGTSSEETQTGRAMKRASSISILSGLGVPYPEKALDPPLSPSQIPDPKPTEKKTSRLRNFFGQRPPSELITTHLTEYFPSASKRVLQRTARQSMMRTSGLSGLGKTDSHRNSTRDSNRDSTMSWNPPLPSRFSSSTQGSQPRLSMSSRASMSSYAAPDAPDKESSSTAPNPEDIPRISLSADNSDVHGDDAKPNLLPPVKFPTESFSESVENVTGSLNKRPSRPVSRTMSNASKRMSYMTELRSKRDRSDTASMMTVDEITAEVESRRDSMAFDSTDDWTQVGNEGDGDDVESSEATLAVEEDEDDNEDVEDEREDDEEEYEDEVLDGEEEETLADDCEEPAKKAVTSKGGTKWIKGALIGAGSFGKVYLGMDAANGLLMAVKQVELPTGSAPNEERKKSMLTALELEIELLKDLQHDNIVQYLYSSLDEDFLNIFLEYVPGGSVTALLRNYGAFEEPLVKNFVRQILEGLNYLHERNIIHRDIKGANILVDNKGGIKISDFGISKKVEDNLMGGNRAHRPSLQGSVFWMAPEVVKQTAHTKKADIWSVGCLVVEMLTGEHPWAQLTQMQAIFKIGSSAKPTIPSDISTDAQDFLARTFELNHGARPSAGELLQHAWIGKKPASSLPKSGVPKVVPVIEVAA